MEEHSKINYALFSAKKTPAHLMKWSMVYVNFILVSCEEIMIQKRFFVLLMTSHAHVISLPDDQVSQDHSDHMIKHNRSIPSKTHQQMWKMPIYQITNPSLNSICSV
ncbi:hypothetical protein AMECASPLE_038313 [Ameca splendens]|uniref:Uncharacterized protein n=1 Tax=Ameca splendens TaxID=208324 RepID=A0ABV1A3K7_9TELE